MALRVVVRLEVVDRLGADDGTKGDDRAVDVGELLEDEQHRIVDYRPGPGDTAAFLADWQVRSRVVVRSFQNECGMGELRVTRHSPQRVEPDVTFANMPMTIDSGIIRRT